MKRFIVSILFASVFFMGLGAIAGGVAAKFKSDEKALEIIRQARTAIGGDASIDAVRSMTINGRTTKTFVINGETRTEPGETDIALQLPDKLMKTVKIGADGEGLGTEIMRKQHDVMVLRSTKDGEGVVAGQGEGTATRKIIIKKDDGTVMSSGDGGKVWVEKGESEALPGDGKRVVIEKAHRAEHEGMRQNELLRLTLGLLLSAPEGMDVDYTFAGEGDVDGTTCSIVNAEFAGSSIKLYISKASSLPVMIAYTGHQMPQIFQFKVEGPKTGDDAKKDVVFFKKDMAEPADAEFQIRFSDYRGVNGVQLPYRWTTTVNGKADETFDVNAYEINPSNISEKFANRKMMVRIPKPVEQ
jgi:hypothetical protein